VINEIMAANSSTVSDQDGEYDDWVELYNGATTAINLTGFYLSDNENDVMKWSFPSGATIQPNDYLIIWCDTAGVTQSGLHTTYRLSADQEEVYLSDPTGNVIDAVHYVNMPTDKAYARVPNGTGIMQYQDHTYDDINQLVSAADNTISKSKMRVYPNPSNSRVYILGATEKICIYNMMGQLIHCFEGVKSLDIGHLDSGIYFVKSGDNVAEIIKQ